MSGTAWTNWAGNITFRPRAVHRPTSVAELRELVAGSDRLRVLGTGHSFNRLADTSGDLVSLAGLPPTIEIDAEAATVTVAGAVRYGELATRLHAAGFALPNLGSLPHISVAGACATGTHGSGDRNGGLATAVRAIELVGADGALRTVARDTDDTFAGSVVALGALGPATRLTLELVPTFEVRQHVYDDLPLAAFDTHWEELFASAYSVSLFTDWTGPRFDQVWLKRRTGDPPPPTSLFGAAPADGPRHPVRGMPPVHCTEQLGAPGPWHTRLPHFRLGFTPSSGDELQSEYFVPREHAVAAVAAVEGLRDRIAKVVQVCEVRTVAADDLWLSPSQGRDSVAIHFTWTSDEQAVAAVVAQVEARLAPFAARPHWGKVFGMPPRVVAERYERLHDFRTLLTTHDPAGVFRNDLLNAYLHL